ncbi:DMT family transporter [Dichotomicrobium thermohalophilum]|uniref:EamA domain-containing membrane protein RarD n=1 Tax=Dichotomicrobium thermohalophilum TaxID=933063 RepID=A0A397Q749_9HYPH|nr:EamA family transporter [Dichotomicrobium thermohalophilum]RIA56878.1 EamA domain-containing membrane protein RarD [Dichotomicrobium thermohalophilum]
MSDVPAINTSMSASEWAMLITLSLLWGASFFFNGVAVQSLPTFTVVVARVLIAAVILHLALRASGLRMPRDARLWRTFFAMAFINNVMPFSLIVWGQSHIASGLAAIVNATTPLFTVMIAHVFTSDEKLTRGRLAGVIIGLFGVTVMIGLDALRNLGVNVVAQLAVLGAAMCYASAAVFGRRFRTLKVTPLQTATGQTSAASIILLPVMFLVDQPWTLQMPGVATIAALFAVAALSTALAYIIYFRLLASAGATNVLLVTFLVPVVAILLGTLFLGEVLQPQHLLGMGLIGLGLAAIDGRPWRLLMRC